MMLFLVFLLREQVNEKNPFHFIYQIASVMEETSTWVLMYQLSLSLLIED